MRQWFFHLMLSVILLGFACSDSSTGPNKNNNGATPTVSETIGIAGGTVAAENISLTVPAGSFAAVRLK